MPGSAVRQSGKGVAGVPVHILNLSSLGGRDNSDKRARSTQRDAFLKKKQTDLTDVFPRLLLSRNASAAG